MPQHVCNGAVLMCSFGVAPSTLTVLPVERVMTSSQPAATIMDYQPLVNVQPFGMCITPTDNTCQLMCIWGGVIQVTIPGQFTEQIP